VHRAAVLGSPIAHSLSPVLHRAAYAALGLTGWSYEAIEMTADRLPEFLNGLDSSWRGLSLTMPLKAAVLPLLDEISPLAQLVGAVNTVRITPADRTVVLSGDNTDVPGFAAVLASHGHPTPSRPVLLGAGNTAAAALAAVAHETHPVTVLARRPTRARQALSRLAEQLGVPLDVQPWPQSGPDDPSLRLLVDADVVLATTPPGACDELADALDHLSGHGAAHLLSGLLVDVVYARWPTRLAHAWSQSGGQVAGGLELLEEQAARQVPIFTGVDCSPESLTEVMRRAGEEALRDASSAGAGGGVGGEAGAAPRRP
jgi:shikimate dehydrogenase